MSDTSSITIEDQGRLEFTLNTRRRIADTMLKNGIPEDKEDRQLLMSALDGMDRTVLGRARIKSEDSANQSNQQTANMVAMLLTRITPRNISFNGERQTVPTLDESIQLDSVVEGETEIKPKQITYDTFCDGIATP